MLARVFTHIYICLAGFCAFALCGCTRTNQLMIKPADGLLTFCFPSAQGFAGGSKNSDCIHELEALGFTKAENVSLAGGGGIYIADDGHVLRSEELTALSPDVPPQKQLFPPKGSALKPGDAIVAVNGVITRTRSEIVPRLIGKPGQQVTVRIRRTNLEQDVIMSFTPWSECKGNIFYDERFFFHFEYPDHILHGRR
jgi:hypothetical protein